MLSPKDIFNNLVGWAAFITEIYKPATKIIEMVRDNPEYFDAKAGDKCLEKAADKLEKLIKEKKNGKKNN